jgi:stage II sporulation protein D
MKKLYKSLIASMLILVSSQIHSDDTITAMTQEYKQHKKIKVLLEKDVANALLEIKGAYQVIDPYDNTRIGSGFLGKRFLVRPTNVGLKWGEEFVDIHQIHIIPKNRESVLVNGIQYDGSVFIYKIGNKVSIINEIAIDDYLKSTLTRSFSHHLEKEVMAAIAIAARTTTYYHIDKNKDVYWHISANKYGYNGSALILKDSAIVSSIDATTNMIMLNANEGINQPFIAYWNENSGGKTAAFHSIYRKDSSAPKRGIVSDHANLDREDSKWVSTFTKHQLSNLLKIGSIAKVELFFDSNSSKAYGVRVTDLNNQNHDYDFKSFRRMLSKRKILSNDLSVTLENDYVKFVGFGKGLGVGLCLYSASAMAQNGEMAIRILSKFYPETFLINLTAINQFKPVLQEKINSPRL